MTPPRKMLHMNAGFDKFFVNDAYRADFESKLDLIVGFRGTSQWARHKTWNLDSYAYKNTFSETTSPYAVYQNDSDGGALWLPFAAKPDGSYARRSMDLTAEKYREGFAASCRDALNDGAEGMFFDDTNLSWARMFRKTGGATPLIQFDTPEYYTSTETGRTGWAALLGDFLHDVTNRIRSTHPAAKFIFNPVWYDLAPTKPDGTPDFTTVKRWQDPRFIYVFDQSDWCIIEQGHSDPGLNNGPGSDGGQSFALRSQFYYVDKIHSRGKGVIVYFRAGSAAQRKYEMACWLSHRNSDDLLGIWGESASWPNLDPVLDEDLGERVRYVDTNGTGTQSVVGFNMGSESFTPGEATKPVDISHTLLPLQGRGARRFDGVNDYITFPRGAYDGTGALTLAALVRNTAVPTTARYAVSCDTAGGCKGGLGILKPGTPVADTVHLYAGGGTTWSTAVSIPVPQNEWCIIAATKAPGTTAPTLHSFVLSTSTWTHGVGYAARNNMEVFDNLVVASWHQISNEWTGDIGLVAGWDKVLTQAQITELAAGLRTRAWHENTGGTPTFLFEGRQGFASDVMVDLTGGVKAIDIHEAIESPDDPPGWTWGLPGVASIRVNGAWTPAAPQGQLLKLDGAFAPVKGA